MYKSHYLKESEIEKLKPHLINVDYRLISAFSNIKSTVFVLFILTNIMLIFSSITLYFVKNKTGLGQLHLKKSYVHILEHLSTPCFFSFQMSSQIVILVSAFVYLRFAKSYWSDMFILEGTQLLHFDAYLSFMCLVSTFYTFMILVITASNKEWWGLHRKLKLKRTWYARAHQTIMKKAGDVESKRAQLNSLERKFNTEEDRFDELKQFIGQIQSEGLYSSFSGFDRSILHVLLKMILPVAFASILVYLDTVWLVIIVPVLFLVYFCVQLLWIRAKNSSKDWFIFAIFMMTGYLSGLLFIEENPLPLNYIGWLCISLFFGLICATSIKYLRKFARIIKIILIGKKQNYEVKKMRFSVS